MESLLSRKDLVEIVAELEHEQWMAWSKTTAKRLDAETRARWKRYWIPYSKLTEKVKEQDRIWARKILRALDRKLQSAKIRKRR